LVIKKSWSFPTEARKEGEATKNFAVLGGLISRAPRREHCSQKLPRKKG